MGMPEQKYPRDKHATISVISHKAQDFPSISPDKISFSIFIVCPVAALILTFDVTSSSNELFADLINFLKKALLPTFTVTFVLSNSIFGSTFAATLNGKTAEHSSYSTSICHSPKMVESSPSDFCPNGLTKFNMREDLSYLIIFPLSS